MNSYLMWSPLRSLWRDVRSLLAAGLVGGAAAGVFALFHWLAAALVNFARSIAKHMSIKKTCR